MTGKITKKNTPARKFFIYYDSFQGVPQVINSSIINIFISSKSLGLVMLSVGLPFAISNVRVTYFTATIARLVAVFVP